MTERKRIWGWYFFDWANQPYSTLLMTFIFAPYFASAVAADPVRGQQDWGTMLTVTGLCIALLAPVLGAVADSGGGRRGWILLWSVFYVGGAFSLWWAEPGMETTFWILVAFGLGVIGLEFGIIFTNAILPELGPREALGRISGSAWAFGYAGGVLSLLIVLAFLAENETGHTLIGLKPLFGLDPEAREGTRAVGPLTAAWYVLFVIPFFLWVPQDRRQTTRRQPIQATRAALRDLGGTLRRLPRQPSLFAWLGSSMLFRDALNGIYAFGGIYAAGVLGWDITRIGLFGIVAAIAGAVFCWFGGRADSRFGPMPVIIACICALIAVCVIVVLTDRTMVLGMAVPAGSSLPDIAFFLCGGVIGAAGGSLQASGRTMMVRQANPARMTEAFGLYALSGKATAFLAPALVAMATMITNDQRLGVAPLIVLFILALLLLFWVEPEGERITTCAAS
ncbi:MFS transporter [Plastorhodobacter daqingensis]|uniref:MFS transporter n=1 Tax=Plastorhodobacter daqingensis TaxID=1387281 RepID=A0ABW2UPF8_9RHOB